MIVERLALGDFRNYERLDIRLPRGMAMFVGDNAQGKTNVLEALLVLCVGRSHRTGHDRDLIRQGAQAAYLQAAVQRRDGGHTLNMTLNAQGARKLSADGAPLARMSEMIGRLNAVLFAPEDVSLVKDSPAERRRFVDMALSQLRPSYFAALQRYGRALKQRQSLLREIPKNPSLRASLPAWDEQLALEGAHLQGRRREMLARLFQLAAHYANTLTDGAEALDARYAPSFPGEATPSALYDALQAAQGADIARCQTSVGPHRDDVAIALCGREARLFASQGQQRTIALALRLAQADLYAADTGEPPVLMLDDVFSELDETRRRLLVQIAARRDTQTLITATEPVPGIPAHIFAVRGGRIEGGGERG